MKTTFILAATLFSITAFTENPLNDKAKQNFDNNGAPVKNPTGPVNAPYSNSVALSVIAYDSVRALTELNDPYNADAYPWISPDGLRLYYTSGADSNKMMFTQRATTNDYFAPPTLIPVSVSSPTSYWLSANELDIYISNGGGLFFAHRNTVTSPFNTPVSISLTGTSFTFISGASLNNAQDRLFLYSASVGIIEFSRTSSTSFAYVRTLPVPLGYVAKPGQLSKDELTFFFSASFNGGKPLLYQLTRSNPSDSFNISTFQLIQGINDTAFRQHQPTMSDSLNWVAFVRVTQNAWSENELYIARRANLTSIDDADENSINISIFPNPSTGRFNIYPENDKGIKEKPLIEIYDISGEKVLAQKSNEIDIAGYPKGIYFVKIYNGRGISISKIILQ